MNSTDESTITELWYSLHHDELVALIQEAANQDEQDDFDAAKTYSETRETLERNHQALLDAGHSESELAGMSLAELMDADWIAQQLQGEAGNGPTGHELTKQIKNCAPKGQSVRITSLLADLTDSQVRQIREGTRCATVDEVAQLAVAYGITTGELLGIVDADEVILLRLWRNMEESKREALLRLLS